MINIIALEKGRYYIGKHSITDIQNGYGYVLVDKDVIIAYAAIIFGVEPAYNDIQGKWLSNGAYAVVHRVATAGNIKQKGMGTSLFLLVEELCLQKNIYSIIYV